MVKKKRGEKGKSNGGKKESQPSSETPSGSSETSSSTLHHATGDVGASDEQPKQLPKRVDAVPSDETTFGQDRGAISKSHAAAAAPLPSSSAATLPSSSVASSGSLASGLASFKTQEVAAVSAQQSTQRTWGRGMGTTPGRVHQSSEVKANISVAGGDIKSSTEPISTPSLKQPAVAFAEQSTPRTRGKGMGIQTTPERVHQRTEVKASISFGGGDIKSPLEPASTSPVKQTVLQKEDILKSMAGFKIKSAMPTSSKAIKPIPRPGYGEAGRKISLRANFFEMKINYDKIVIYHYDIDIKPEIKSKEKLRQIVDIFLKEQFFRGVTSAYDGRKSLYTNKLLKVTNKDKFSVTLEGANKPVDVAIQYAAQISLSTLKDFFSRNAEFPQEAVQSLDVVLREIPNHEFIPLRQFFFLNPIRNARIDLRENPGLELWNGYYQSVRPAWKCMMLQVDSSVRVFHKGQRVIDLCAEFFDCSVDELNDRPMNVKEHQNFENHIKGLQVEIDTEKFSMLGRRSYKLIGLSKQIAKDQTFPMTMPDGKEIPKKVGDYYQTQYNVKLCYPVLHCLQAQPADKHRYLPMEVCVVKKGQQLKKLTEHLTSQLIKYSAKPAPEREREINELVSKIEFGNNQIAQAFGMSISKKMIEFDGRILDAPQIEYLNKKVITVKDGSWNMQQAKFISSATVKQMAVLCFDRYVNNSLEDFISKLIKNAQQVGMILPQPSAYKSGNDVKDVSKLMKSVCPSQPSDCLIVVVLPSKKSNDIYGEIKKVGDLELGIATQCVQSKNVNNCKEQTLTNICLKINAKLGKTNSIILHEQRSKILLTPCLIMGADVTHPSPGDTTSPSIAAVTGSYDTKVSSYVARISMQEHRKEIIADLEGITKQILDNFHSHHNIYPKRIIFYRDGVSEGQFKLVLAEELQAIQRACYLIGPSYQPCITFITVQKRHHTRLFAVNRANQIGKSGNVPAGTTVDTNIVHPIEFDFYLCSHQGIQGTSRPAHYYVLYDDSNFDADTIQQFTYHLCHLYARCTRSVSIPAPVYYAHHCAFRGRYYLERMGNQGKLPEGNRDAQDVLNSMNKKCLIHPNYRGMFFA